uniref:Uncharacterized protein n=1 Tax=Heterorhabditis bacteriophora TaxID=37862 RepID=A0A1I7WTG0_HETBA
MASTRLLLSPFHFNFCGKLLLYLNKYIHIKSYHTNSLFNNNRLFIVR